MISQIIDIFLTIIDFIIEIVGFNIKDKKRVIISTIVIGVLLLFYYIFTIFYYYKLTESNDSKAKKCLEGQNNMVWNIYQKPLNMQKKELLEHTLKEFKIASSHNTYIPCNQNLDIASKIAIKRAILLGCRVIELDLFINQSDSNPLITHGVEGDTVEDDIYTTSTLNFTEVCREINNYAFKKTDDPLIITLELNTHSNEYTNNKTANILKNIFGDKLLKKDNNRSIGDYTLKELMGKVIILSGGGVSGELKDIINNTWYDEKLQNISSNTEITDELINFNKTGITRVYPAGNIGGNFSRNFDPKKILGCRMSNSCIKLSNK